MPDTEIAVIGDIMLDVVESGTVSRVSPEAPVVVLLNPVVTSVLGGAANTAANVDRLGSAVSLLGIIGDDDAGLRCRSLIGAAGLRDGTLASPTSRTTVKTRYVAGGQQIVRVDREQPAPFDAVRALTEAVAGLREDAAAIVLSDYDKGAVTEAVALAAITRAVRGDIPVVVDSKKTAVDLFRGCTVIAPNHLEATRMTGSTDPATAARAIADRTRSAVLVTLGADGMLLLHEGALTHIPSHAREVADVTGAGDTVTAALAVALARGDSMLDAARWANIAAAVSVSHRGTYAVSADDVAGFAIG